jgi:hypothetical protein
LAPYFTVPNEYDDVTVPVELKNTESNIEIRCILKDAKTNIIRYSDGVVIVTLVDGSNGDPAITITSTNPVISLSADEYGDVAANTTQTSLVKVYEGLNEKTDFTVELISPTNSFASIVDDKKTIQVSSGATKNNFGSKNSVSGTVKVQVTYNNKSYEYE